MFTTNLKDVNYRAKLVKLGVPLKHPNADKLQMFTIDFQNIITDLSYKEGDLMVYFPIECCINTEFISYINGFEDNILNADTSQKGFFNNKGRVRCLKLRGEPSSGVLLKMELLSNWLNTKRDTVLIWEDGVEFDSVDDILICKKYVPQYNNKHHGFGTGSQKSSVKGISKLVEGQFRLHNDTENLRKNIHKLEVTDYISINYKKHGTSFVCGNVLVNKSLTWWDKLLKKCGVNIIDKEYGIIYSSRRVVKNQYETVNKSGYYKEDIWGIVKRELQHSIPKGFTLYGEILGYTTTGEAIQSMGGMAYDYGCNIGEHKTFIYRITFTNEDGLCYELSDPQIKEFCDNQHLNYSDTLYYFGTIENYLNEFTDWECDSDEDWRGVFVETLEKQHLEKPCWMCNNKLPAEGVVVRKNTLFEYEAFKLKSFAFLNAETIALDSAQTNIEDIN